MVPLFGALGVSLEGRELTSCRQSTRISIENVPCKLEPGFRISKHDTVKENCHHLDHRFVA